MSEKFCTLRFRVLASCIIASLLMLTTFLGYGVYNVYKYRTDFLATNQYVVDFYAQQFSYDFESLKNYVTSVVTRDTSFLALSSGSLSQANKVSAEYYLANAMQNKAKSLNKHGVIFYYDKGDNILRSKYSERYSEEERYFENRELKKWLYDYNDLNKASIVNLNNSNCLVYIHPYKDKYMGFILDIEKYFSDQLNTSQDEQQIIFSDINNMFLASAGENIVSPEIFATHANKAWANGYEYVMVQSFIGNKNILNDMKITLIRPYWQFFSFWKDIEFWMFIVVVPLVGIALFFIIYRYLNQILLLPTDRLLKRIYQIQNPNEIPAQETKNNIKEFQEINDNIDALITKINNLQYENYLSELETQNIKQQCLRLQLNPHFYINCLNSMNAMVERNDKLNLQTFIYTMSHYMRYMFRNVSDIVLLSEELNAIEMYHRMITMLYGQPFLYTQHISDEIKRFGVPVLCIQTFIENSCKYARKNGKILSVSVSGNIVQDENKELLYLNITDNGPGYSDDNLLLYNMNDDTINSSNEKVGIKNIIQRLRLLYGSKAKIIFYNKPSSGAVTEIYLPKTTKE